MSKKMWDPGEDESPSQEEIIQTTRLARDHAFDHFDSGRASNASYEDNNFSSYRHSWGWFGVNRAGATRFQYRRGEEYGPHGDTPPPRRQAVRSKGS